MTPRNREHLGGHIVGWIAQVSQAHESLACFDPCLDAHDRERMRRFRFPEDRARFVLGRGLLRTCLGQYLQRSPSSIKLAYTDRDRPFLADDESIHFSISHTHDLVAVAVTAKARVGIDLEFVQVYPDLAELAERIFSATDLQIFQTLSRNDAQEAFFRAWTRKEAYLKARGEGISESLQDISVSIGPEEISSIRDNRDASAAATWRMFSLPVPAGYRGSLACDDLGKKLQFMKVHVDKGGVIPEVGSGQNSF